MSLMYADPKTEPTPSAPRPPTRTPRGTLRSDLWKGFVAFGVVLSLIFSFYAATRAPGATSTAGGSGTLDLTLSELKIEPNELTAPAGHVVLNIRNSGAVAHNVAIDALDKASPMIDPGQSATLDLGNVSAGTYELYCQVSGHKEGGMTATLVVGEGGGGTHAMTADEMDASYMKGLKAFPAKTKGLGGQVMEPVMDGGVKVYEMTASEVDWEVEPGVVKKAMAYNGVVPGPQIRVKKGDKIRVVLHNELEESTAIHFHGQDVPNAQDGVPGITQPVVKPGDSYTYEFTVPTAGTHIYHSHMNGATQIPLGLWGAFIVEGKNEPVVDVDQTIVLNDGPLGYTINGKSFPATSPIVAEPGQTVRLRYLNEGLQGHPMHLHGMPQKVIAQDGYPVPQPYLVDTVWVAPGQRFDVLVEPRAGVWAFHCHILSHAEKETGMFGMVTALVAQEG
jgi:FtsP/CotA-like multicopper oxidase with cupredoxin domain